MKILLCLFTILFNMQLHAQNDYPIVLIHGFMGWGKVKWENIIIGEVIKIISI